MSTTFYCTALTNLSPADAAAIKAADALDPDWHNTVEPGAEWDRLMAIEERAWQAREREMGMGPNFSERNMSELLGQLGLEGEPWAGEVLAHDLLVACDAYLAAPDGQDTPGYDGYARGGEGCRVIEGPRTAAALAGRVERVRAFAQRALDANPLALVYWG